MFPLIISVYTDFLKLFIQTTKHTKTYKNLCLRCEDYS